MPPIEPLLVIEGKKCPSTGTEKFLYCPSKYDVTRSGSESQYGGEIWAAQNEPDGCRQEDTEGSSRQRWETEHNGSGHRHRHPESHGSEEAKIPREEHLILS